MTTRSASSILPTRSERIDGSWVRQARALRTRVILPQLGWSERGACFQGGGQLIQLRSSGTIPPLARRHNCILRVPVLGWKYNSSEHFRRSDYGYGPPSVCAARLHKVTATVHMRLLTSENNRSRRRKPGAWRYANLDQPTYCVHESIGSSK